MARNRPETDEQEDLQESKEEIKATVVEREVTLSLLNQKLNYLISLLESK